jgi:hypothetical protein
MTLEMDNTFRIDYDSVSQSSFQLLIMNRHYTVSHDGINDDISISFFDRSELVRTFSIPKPNDDLLSVLTWCVFDSEAGCYSLKRS